MVLDVVAYRVRGDLQPVRDALRPLDLDPTGKCSAGPSMGVNS